MNSIDISLNDNNPCNNTQPVQLNAIILGDMDKMQGGRERRYIPPGQHFLGERIKKKKRITELLCARSSWVLKISGRRKSTSVLEKLSVLEGKQTSSRANEVRCLASDKNTAGHVYFAEMENTILHNGARHRKV